MTTIVGKTIASGLIVMVAVLGGCSGSGVAVQQLAGGTVQTLATDHLSAVTLIRNWMNVLYFQVPQGGGPDVNMEDLPGGGMRFYGTQSDDSTFDWVINPDESGSGTQQFPGGLTKQASWSAPDWNGDELTQDLNEVYSNGARLQYRFTADYAQDPLPQEWRGQATEPGGQTMSFRLSRVQERSDQLQLTLPDGLQVTLTVPLTWTDGAAYWPQFATGATGQVAAAGRTPLNLRLTGSGDQWNQWSFTSGHYSGQFSLGSDLIGQGRLEQGGQVVAALSWDAALAGNLSVVAGGSEEVGPSAAAASFQMDQWVGSIAALGPAPIY